MRSLAFILVWLLGPVVVHAQGFGQSLPFLAKNLTAYYDLTNDLVAYWTFDSQSSGSTYDSVGNLQAYPDADAISHITGKVGNAVLFTSATNYFYTVNDTDAISSTTNWTMAFWIKRTNTSPTHYNVLSKSVSSFWGDYKSVVLGSSATSIQVFDTDGLHYAETTGVGVGTNAWFLYVAQLRNSGSTATVRVRVASEASLYAWVEQSYAGGVIYSNTTANLTFGRQTYSTQSMFQGLLDEWGYWKRNLSDQDITNLWNGGIGLGYPLIYYK